MNDWEYLDMIERNLADQDTVWNQGITYDFEIENYEDDYD